MMRGNDAAYQNNGGTRMAEEDSLEKRIERLEGDVKSIKTAIKLLVALVKSLINRLKD